MPAANMPANAIPVAALVIGMATVIMWFSARLVGVTKAGLGRSFLATIGVSLIVGVVASSVSALGTVLGGALAVAGLVGSVAVIRMAFRIPTLPAFLIWVVNVMVQIILVAIYLRPYVSAPVHK